MMTTIPIYLINLPKDSARKDHSLKELETCKLLENLVFTGAIYGATLSEESLSNLYNSADNLKKYHKIMSNGEIGCYASHIECWKKIAASTAPFALILEDDMKISPSINHIIKTIQELEINFDIIKLVGRENESILKKIKIAPEFELIEYFRVPSYTGAYLVSKRGAEKLLQARSKFFRPIDVDLRFWWEIDPNFIMYGINPYPTSHAHFSSVLGNRASSPHTAIKYRWLKFKTQLFYVILLLLNVTKKHLTSTLKTNQSEK